jgi:8-oxo-dGTP pyrophosphatase MutT (NUDIX family)
LTYVAELRESVGDRPVLLPGVALLAFDADGRLLLQQRVDDGTWSLVGGLLEIGESPEAGMRREAAEEVGLQVGDLELCDAVGGADYYHDYPGQGRVYGVTAVYRVTGLRDQARPDREESRAATFFRLADLPTELERTTRLILERQRIFPGAERTGAGSS